MEYQSKVSAPEHKAGGTKSPDPVKTSTATRGFGGGSATLGTHSCDPVKGGDGKSAVKGFSGGGVKGGKV
jgi:hypothetical protein